MTTNTRVSYACSVSNIKKAIAAYELKEYSSIRKCAHAFTIPESTLRHHLRGRTSRSYAHEHMQILSNAEGKTLVRWLTRLTSTGFLASPALAIEIADRGTSWIKVYDGIDRIHLCHVQLDKLTSSSY